ncbi:MAG TPA: molybdopterin dehydrogenase, partial [Planctomycetota bacterium]|nr:molybdopterin dehydrogenase [Planctomycetota bacterium]
FVLPGVTAQRENVLAPNEIITHVTLGAASPRSATYIVRSKEANDWPVGLAAVSLQIENGACTGARVCLGAVAPTPWRVPAAEAALQGKPVTEETAAAAADAAIAGATPLSQNGYKVATARAAVRRAILSAAAR